MCKKSIDLCMVDFKVEYFQRRQSLQCHEKNIMWPHKSVWGKKENLFKKNRWENDVIFMVILAMA